MTWRFMQWFKESSGADSAGVDWRWLVPILNWLMLGLGVALLGWGLYRLAQTVLKQVPRQQSVSRKREPVRSPLNWLEIAQAAQAKQDYRAAFQALYQALLLHLDEAGLLRHDVARTDREAMQQLDRLWSLSDQPIAVRDDWALLFETHEALCFGGDDVSREHFLQCRGAYDQLIPHLPLPSSLLPKP